MSENQLSPEGLLSQLTAVLHELAGSHELLLRKIRGVRLEHPDADPWAIEDLQHANFVDAAGPHSLPFVDMPVGESNRALHASPLAAHALATDEIEEADESPHPEFLDPLDRPIDTKNILPNHAQHSLTVDQVGTADRVAHRETLRSSDSVEAGHTDHSDPNSTDRNYDFFEELDARLAHLVVSPEPDPGQN